MCFFVWDQKESNGNSGHNKMPNNLYTPWFRRNDKSTKVLNLSKMI